MSFKNISRKICIYLLGITLLSGCSSMQKIEKEPLKLKHQRIQLAQNSQIDYLSYISGNDDQEDIQYNSIDS